MPAPGSGVHHPGLPGWLGVALMVRTGDEGVWPASPRQGSLHRPIHDRRFGSGSRAQRGSFFPNGDHQLVRPRRAATIGPIALFDLETAVGPGLARGLPTAYLASCSASCRTGRARPSPSRLRRCVPLAKSPCGNNGPRPWSWTSSLGALSGLPRTRTVRVHVELLARYRPLSLIRLETQENRRD